MTVECLCSTCCERCCFIALSYSVASECLLVELPTFANTHLHYSLAHLLKGCIVRDGDHLHVASICQPLQKASQWSVWDAAKLKMTRCHAHSKYSTAASNSNSAQTGSCMAEVPETDIVCPLPAASWQQDAGSSHPGLHPPGHNQAGLGSI